ncbi:MAG: cobalamin-binding protein [Deltaproteobacteria bacterium]|nr:cobalamin-binding protein [Deltaproteobacteria bacterium]
MKIRKTWGLIKFTLLLIAFLFTTPVLLSAKTVKDQLGRTVAVPDNPQRIVSLAPSITEIVFALGKGDLLKGVTQFSDYPEEAKTIHRVGSYVNLNLEKIVVLKPDLCIAVKDGNPRSVVERLESLNIPVYAVDPRNLESVMETFLEVGGLINASENATKIVINMRARITKVESLVRTADDAPRVFYQIGISPIVSAGTNTFIHELIEMAGGKNLAKGPVPYPRFSREKVISLVPEVFIITSMAGVEVHEKVKAEWQRWDTLPAIKNNRIYFVDSNVFDRPGPRLVDGLEILVKIIHPEFFVTINNRGGR